VFRTRHLSLVIIAVLLLSLTLAACSSEGGATATSPAAKALLESAKTKDAKEAAANASQATTAEEAALTVGDKAFTLEELQALTTATATTDEGEVTGVSLKAVLEAAGLTAETITLTASDGYTADVAVAEIDDTAVLSIEDGKINAVIPTVAKSAWVDDVVSISAK